MFSTTLEWKVFFSHLVLTKMPCLGLDQGKSRLGLEVSGLAPFTDPVNRIEHHFFSQVSAPEPKPSSGPAKASKTRQVKVQVNDAVQTDLDKGVFDSKYEASVSWHFSYGKTRNIVGLIFKT